MSERRCFSTLFSRNFLSKGKKIGLDDLEDPLTLNFDLVDFEIRIIICFAILKNFVVS